MAELILTEAEQTADSYLAWDDAALGKLVRHLSANSSHYQDHNRPLVCCLFAAELISNQI